MRLLLIGATGRTGVHAAMLADTLGLSTVALVRNAAKLPAHARLAKVVEGDASDPAAVMRATEAVDAIVSTAGPVAGSPPDLMRVIASNVVAAAESRGIKRVIWLTGAGVRDNEDRPKPIDRFFGGLIKLLQPSVLADSTAAVDRLRDSDLDYTVLRAPMLTNRPARGGYHIGYIGPDSGVRIARADVARAMLDQVTSTTWLRKAPAIWE